MRLANLFSDNMILQRDRPVPIWGWSQPGETVTVKFAGQTKSTTAAADGKWMVTLDPLPASVAPRELRAGPCRIQNVLVGDVWLGSGQSNMQWPLEKCDNAASEVAAANHFGLRLFTVPNIAKLTPQTDVEATWQVCSSATSCAFSAVAYFFGREVWQRTGIPIGLINCSWGGTRIAAWISRAALLADPASCTELETVPAWLASKASPPPFDQEKWEHALGTPDPGNAGFAEGWAAFDYADHTWPVMELPGTWQFAGFNFSGVFWFRREVNVPPAAAGQPAVLQIGACDKTDVTYFNGVQVGATGFETKSSWNTPRVYSIPGELVRPGRNVITVRVYSNCFQAGMTGPVSALELSVANAPALPLAGPWRYQVERNFGYVAQPPMPNAVLPPGEGNPNTPHILYDSMVTSLVPAAIRGVLWYQGEGDLYRARHYRTLFPMLIRDWRQTFQQPALPFYFVQIPNFTAPQRAPVESGYAELREAQMLTLCAPHTGMAVTIDIGDARDAHPKNKYDVGKRLAQHALANVYGQPVVPNGPLYRSHRIEGGAIRIEFDYAAGLQTKNGEPVHGCAIAGANEKFEWAEARIDGETIVVRSHLVRQPLAVRYGWANNPRVNLYNAAGLPASPFRTDVD